MKLTETSFIVDANQSDTFQAFESSGAHDCNGSVIITEVQLASGTVLRFVDEGRSIGSDTDEGGVGVIEVTAPQAQAILPTMLREYGPSPLEIFMAAAPGTSAPDRLVKDHRQAAKLRQTLSPTPRTLKLVSSLDHAKAYVPAHIVADLSPKHGLEVDYCLGLAGDYHFDFRSMEADVFGLQLSEHGHGHNLDHSHYGVTGVSSRRALGVCNAGGYVKMVNIQYQWIQGVWIDVPIAQNGSNTLFPHVSLFYYSDSWPAAYRYRIKVAFTAIVDGNIVHTEGSW